MARMDELSIEQIRPRGIARRMRRPTRSIDRGAMAEAHGFCYAASLDQMQLSPSGAKEWFEIA